LSRGADTTTVKNRRPKSNDMSYGTVWKDLGKQEYQHRNQNEHNKGDGNERGNDMDAKEIGQR